jgi:hypothetical protein
MGAPAVPASSQAQAGLGAPSTNPRVTSPQTSPSPIPQPASSGGRPPPSTYQAQGNVPNFGSFGESGDANVGFSIPSFVSDFDAQTKKKPHHPKNYCTTAQGAAHLCATFLLQKSL